MSEDKGTGSSFGKVANKEFPLGVEYAKLQARVKELEKELRHHKAIFADKTRVQELEANLTAIECYITNCNPHKDQQSIESDLISIINAVKKGEGS